MPYSILSIFFLYLISPCFGQSIPPDSAFVSAARRQAVAGYERTIHEQAHVFEGNEYIPHDPRIKIHPFYMTDSLQSSSIVYNGVHYQGVRMQYDIVWDQLAVLPPGGGYKLRLRNEHIGAFWLGTHQFSRIVGDSAAGIPTGFYEILYNGRTKALSHRIKTVHEDISSGAYHAEYLVKDRFYIMKQGVYAEVRSKRSVLSLFPDQAKNLRKYIRTNNLKFNDMQREEAVSRVTQQYDELTR